MKKLIFLIPILIIGLAACESVNFDDDINADDDAVTDPTTESLLAAAMNDFFTLTGRNYYLKPLLYVQYESQYVYTAEMCYGVIQGAWGAWYVNNLNNLQAIIQINSQEDVPPLVRSFGYPANQIGVSKIFSSFIWKRVTDTYGPIPYKKALNDSVLTPPYTPQEEIYKDLVETIRAGRDMLEPSRLGPTGDVVYGGGVEEWAKFANSLLMSIAIQMSEVNPNAPQVFNEALNHPAGYIDEIGEELWYNYQKINGIQNPISAIRRPDYNLANTLVDAMKGLSDDRNSTADPVFSSDTFDSRLILYAATDTGATLPGRPYGIAPNGDDLGPYSQISKDMTDAGKPLHYMTAAYTFLNRAEAAALGWTTENAALLLEKAIIMSYKTLDAHYGSSLSSEAAAFAAARVADAATAPGGILQVIREEKWISLFPRSFQPWAEYRRTGVPGLIPAECAKNAKGNVPNRYIYPSSEPGTNSKAYEEGVQMLSPAEDAYFPLFWWNEQ